MQREIKFRVEIEKEDGTSTVWDVATKKPKRKDHKGWYKQHGYVKRLVTEHPYADSRGYVMEHRLVIEENNCMFLPKDVQIHHINGVRDDNRLENLEILSAKDHAKKHDIGERNDNGRFIASEPIFEELKFRLLNTDTGLTQVYTLSKLIGTTFRRGAFQFRGRFTGLLDENGVEIYEGDIISFIEVDEDSCMGDEEELGGVIIWVDRCAEFRCQYPSGQRRGMSTIVDFQCVYNVEVIGNVYENPELLKELDEYTK